MHALATQHTYTHIRAPTYHAQLASKRQRANVDCSDDIALKLLSGVCFVDWFHLPSSVCGMSIKRGSDLLLGSTQVGSRNSSKNACCERAIGR